MTQQAPIPPAETPAGDRVRISCPGCGRNDRVNWPASQPSFHWKCFNCNKEFDLKRKGGH